MIPINLRAIQRIDFTLSRTIIYKDFIVCFIKDHN